MKKFLAGLAFAGLLACGSYALAQSYPPAQVPSVHPTTDLMPVVPNGAPSSNQQFLTPSQITSSSFYVKITTAGLPYTGYAGTFANNQSAIILINGAGITYFYATFAPSPSDGAKECVSSGGSVLQALYATANTGQTVNNSGGATGVSLTNATACWTFSLSNLTWDRS